MIGIPMFFTGLLLKFVGWLTQKPFVPYSDADWEADVAKAEKRMAAAAKEAAYTSRHIHPERN